MGFHTNIVFVPGYDGTKTEPGAAAAVRHWASTLSAVPTNWVNTDGALPNQTDFGAFTVADQSIGGSVKKLAAVSGQYKTVTNHLSDTHVTMLGYPCNLDDCAIMQRVDSSDHRLPPGFTDAANAYEYGSDMEGGSSGGPWLENFGTGEPLGGTTHEPQPGRGRHVLRLHQRPPEGSGSVGARQVVHVGTTISPATRTRRPAGLEPAPERLEVGGRLAAQIRHSHSLRIEEAKPSSRIVLKDSSAYVKTEPSSRSSSPVLTIASGSRPSR